MTSGTTLYRFFDKAGRLLYVGISDRPFARLRQHRRGKPWWSEIAQQTMEHFQTRELAVAAELAAIRNERPIHNVQGNRQAPVLAAPAESAEADPEPPVGWWCHIATGATPWAEEGERTWWYDDATSAGAPGKKYHVKSVAYMQGQVRGLLGDRLLVQLFSFLDGEPTKIQALDFDPARWRFYETWGAWMDGADAIVGAPEGFSRRMVELFDAPRDYVTGKRKDSPG